MSELSPGWRVSADGVKVQSRQTFWDGETQDVDEQGNVHTATPESIRAYNARNQAAFDDAAEIDAGGQKLTAAQFREIAKQKGWADPAKFNLADVMGYDPTDAFAKAKYEGRVGVNDETSDGSRRASVFLKDKSLWASNSEHSGNIRNRVVGTGAKDTETNDQPLTKEDGYSVEAGTTWKPGDKRFTRVFYDYDDAGKFVGARVETDSRWYEDAAPLIAMAGMAMGMGGAGAAIGGGINSSLGLGTAGQATLGGAAIGAGTSALTGQNPIKGAVMGAITPGIKALNPAGGLLGLTGNAATAANIGIGMGVKTAVSGKRPSLASTAFALARGWK